MFLFFLVATLETDLFTPFPDGFTITEDSGFSQVHVSDQAAFYSAPEEAPLLPLVSRTFVIPGTAEITGTECILQFSGTASRLSRPVAAAGTLRSTDSSVPGERTASQLSISGDSPLVSCHAGTLMNAFTVVSCSVNPWSYDHVTGDLQLAEACDLSISWEPSGPAGNLSPLQADQLEFRMEALTGNAVSVPRGTDGETDYLIITAEDFTDELTPLVSSLEQRGYTVIVITVEEIQGSWSGADLQEDVRNCISHHVTTEGTAFVLLAGDETVVPAREVYTECEGHAELAPSDLYYAGLDGNWDANGNGTYGEWEDDPDLYADVILSRMLFSTEIQAGILVAKNLSYETSGTGDWYSKAVLCGGMLFEDIGYTGVKGCEETAQYFPENFVLTKAYQFNGSDYPDTYFPVIYQGAGWNHYAGHGNDRFVLWAGGDPIMGITRMYGFENQDRYGIHSSIGCHVGDFTDPGVNLVDTLLTLPDGGAVACMFNTSWGWEGYWPEIGSSERLCRNTVKAVYRDKASTLGLAFTSARDQEVPLMTGPYDRVMQSVIAYSAFMEPALEVHGVASGEVLPPQPFALEIRGPNPAYESLSFKVTGTSSGYTISVFDISGRKVMESFDISRNTLTQMNTNDLYPGVYFIHAETPEGGDISGSFVKLR